MESRIGARLAIPAMLLGVLAWLWPIGLGGRMPVGGDVTQFSLGLMAELSRSLKSGRLPLWNDLWGFGFPAIGESQMGVYYPPHWIFYGLLEPETGYAWSLVFHMLWGSLGAYFAARKFGASEVGAAISGFSWSCCGFFLIHLSHQWGYTTGSWMPWAWGLAWSVLGHDGPRRDSYWLAIVLCLQLLPGHFQLAFITEVGVVLLILTQLFEHPRNLAAMGRATLSLGGSFALAAMQLWPTLRLARLASPQRDFEYLSGFAATPLHLVTFLTPGLFERSPLWRMIVWDPFHTSPEEYLGYVGLVPLFLALTALLKGWRGSNAVRALFVVGFATLILALGPYVPGFRLWIMLPGFSFFRAPARWMLGVSLTLSILAGIGFDRLGDWRRPGRALLGFALGGMALPAIILLAVELAMLSSDRPGLPSIASVYAKAFNQLPWRESSVFVNTMLEARRPFNDLRVYRTWARQGVMLRDAPRPIFAAERYRIYREELTGSIILFAALLALVPLAGRPKVFKPLLIGLIFLDLWAFGRDRRDDLGPIATLASQSPIFARLQAMPRGTRTIDGLGNMPMVASAAPVSAYRTLDLPALKALTTLASKTPTTPEERSMILESLKLTGTDLRIFAPGEDPARLTDVATEPIRDVALAGWLFGKDFVAQQGGRAEVLSIWSVPAPHARAWLVPASEVRTIAILGTNSFRSADVFQALKEAVPIGLQSPDPEHRVLAFHADGPSIVVLSQLADPEWSATLERSGTRLQAEPRPAFRGPGGGAWQAIEIPYAGDWTLEMVYRGRDVYQGLGISAIAWLTFGATFVWIRRRRGETK